MQDEDETCSSSHTPIPMMTSQSSQESAPAVKSTVLKTVDNQHKHHCCADGEDEVTTTEQASLDREVGDTSLPENIDNSSHTHPQEILRKCIATGEASDAPIVLRSESGCHYDEEQEEDEEHCHNERTKTHRKCCGAPDCQLDWSFVEKGRLYGCTQVIQKLERAFHRRLDQSLQQEQRSSFILISGISGTGKSAVAKAALEPLATKSKGYYLYGKFDSLQRPEPYAPFVHAVIEFVCRVLEQHSVTVSSPVPHHQRQSPGLSAAGTGLLYNIQSESFCLLDQLKREIQGALSIEGCSLLTSMVPALSHILGTSQYNAGNTSTSSALEPSQDRLKVTFRRFLQAICRPTRPFVFVLDDLQWADASSLDLLECLVCDTENTSLVLVGICRSNEVSQDHKLASMMRRLEDEQNIRIDSIVTKNLSYRATNQLIADVLRQPAHICEPLTDTIHWKTKGNVFYVINYLKALHADKILLPDHEYGTGGWLWDEERWNELYCSSTTKADGAGENNVDECSQEESHVAAVIKLISRQMQRLPEDTQLVLRICACIGAEIDLNLLKKVLADVNLKRATQIAVDEGLLVAKDWYQTRQLPLRLRHSPTPKTIPSMKGNYFMFAHDVVQQAAYSLISDQRKSAVHLSIGRMLFKNMQSIGEFNEHIFVVVNQMSRGMTHINDQLEKDGLAALCLKAGNRAILSSDFHTAVQYFVLGTTLLSQGDNYWSRQYELSLELYNSLAEAEYCVADFEMMDLAIDEVFRHGRNFRDTIRAYATKVYCKVIRISGWYCIVNVP